LSNKTSLVPHNLTIPRICFSRPFGAYDIHISQGINEGPNMVSLKII
jgi:hypothetical protein